MHNFRISRDLTASGIPTGARSRDAEMLRTTGLKGFAAGKQGHPRQNCQSVVDSRIHPSEGIQKSQDGLSPSTSLPQPLVVKLRLQQPAPGPEMSGVWPLPGYLLFLCTLHTCPRARCLPRSLNRMVCRHEAKNGQLLLVCGACKGLHICQASQQAAVSLGDTIVAVGQDTRNIASILCRTPSLLE